MLKETGTEETMAFCHIFIIGGIRLGRASPFPPDYAYGAYLSLDAKESIMCVIINRNTVMRDSLLCKVY